MNTSESELKVEKHQLMGMWKKKVMREDDVKGRVAVVKEGKERDMTSDWEILSEKIQGNHEDGLDESVWSILKQHERTRAQREISNEEEVSTEKEEKMEEWRKAQRKDEWIRKVLEGLKEVEQGHVGARKLSQLLKKEFFWGGLDKSVADVVRKCTKCKLSNAGKNFVPDLMPREVSEPMEIVAMDLLDLGKGERGAKMQILMKKTHKEVNDRLRVERENMKEQYDRKNKNRKANEPRIGDRVYVKKEMKGVKNAKLAIEWEGP
ncbi:hypothetical protein PMAYCL1PPCAC_19307, partial [Pristionchus mayeri]